MKSRENSIDEVAALSAATPEQPLFVASREERMGPIASAGSSSLPFNSSASRTSSADMRTGGARNSETMVFGAEEESSSDNQNRGRPPSGSASSSNTEGDMEEERRKKKEQNKLRWKRWWEKNREAYNQRRRVSFKGSSSKSRVQHRPYALSHNDDSDQSASGGKRFHTSPDFMGNGPQVARDYYELRNTHQNLYHKEPQRSDLSLQSSDSSMGTMRFSPSITGDPLMLSPRSALHFPTVGSAGLLFPSLPKASQSLPHSPILQNRKGLWPGDSEKASQAPIAVPGQGVERVMASAAHGYYAFQDAASQQGPISGYLPRDHGGVLMGRSVSLPAMHSSSYARGNYGYDAPGVAPPVFNYVAPPPLSYVPLQHQEDPRMSAAVGSSFGVGSTNTVDRAARLRPNGPLVTSSTIFQPLPNMAALQILPSSTLSSSGSSAPRLDERSFSRGQFSALRQEQFALNHRKLAPQ